MEYFTGDITQLCRVKCCRAHCWGCAKIFFIAVCRKPAPRYRCPAVEPVSSTAVNRRRSIDPAHRPLCQGAGRRESRRSWNQDTKNRASCALAEEDAEGGPLMPVRCWRVLRQAGFTSGGVLLRLRFYASCQCKAPAAQNFLICSIVDALRRKVHGNKMASIS